MSDDCTSEAESEDDIYVHRLLFWENHDGHLFYTCESRDGRQVYDRSDLMDGGRHQRLVLDFERRRPPPWDHVCAYCGRNPETGCSEGCEECECEECGALCRHIMGVNYGCEKHPVI